MRFRAWFALAVIATILVRVVPCEAFMLPAASSHDCCDRDSCPGFLQASAHHHAPAPSPCCAIADQRHRQAHQQAPTSPVTIAQDDQPIPGLVLAPISSNLHRSDHRSASPRSSPLHVLFSVYLI